MPKYLLDTNTLIYLDDKSSRFHQAINTRLAQLPDDSEVCLSALTVFELQYGVSSAPENVSKQLLATLRFIDEELSVFNVEVKYANVFGELKTLYRKKEGASKEDMKRHNIDFILASTAIVESAIVVSNDGIFSRLASHGARELQYEDWTVL